jgi:hypothetical protein
VVGVLVRVQHAVDPPGPRGQELERSSGGVSTSRVLSFASSSAAVRDLRSRGSVEWHTAQSHPICGTPNEVPVPSSVSRIR